MPYLKSLHIYDKSTGLSHECRFGSEIQGQVQYARERERGKISLASLYFCRNGKTILEVLAIEFPFLYKRYSEVIILYIICALGGNLNQKVISHDFQGYINWSHSTLFWPSWRIYHRVRLHVAAITIPRHIRPDHHYKLAYSNSFDTEVLVVYSMDILILWRGSITPRKCHFIIIHSATPRKRERMRILTMWEILMNM